MKRIIRALLFVLIVCALFTVPSFAFDDMPNDWSTEALQSAVDNGLLTGDGNLLKPRDTLTRAQMAAVMTRAFGAAAEKDLSEFVDIPENAWYRDAMAKAYYMNIFRGDGAGHMNPENPVTREEAFTVLARALCLDENASADALSVFSDADNVSAWAKGSLSSMVEHSYVKGADGRLNPRNHITRAEFAQLMYNIVSLYVDDESDVEKIADARGNVIIRKNVGKLQNLNVKNDLIIADGVEGKLELVSVDVGSRIVVRGSAEIVYSGKTPLIVSNADGVSLTLEKGAEVEKITLPEGSVITDNSKTDETNPTTPSNPSVPSKPDTGDGEENEDEEDIWTDFH